MNAFNVADLKLFIPEIVLSVAVCALVVGDLLVPSAAKKRTLLPWLAVLSLVVAGVFVLQLGSVRTSIFSGQIAIDPVGTLFKGVFLLITLFTIFTSRLSKELPDKHMGEYFALLIAITLGMFLMASANDLLMVFLGVELVSILSYALAGYRLRDKRSSEAALKYVVYGGAASGLMLFGMSLLYGLLGGVELTQLNYALAQWAEGYYRENVLVSTGFPLTLFVGIVFFFAGIAYKIAVVPFHMWSPDVYEGAPTPFTGFLSVGPKAAGFATLMRVFISTFVSPTHDGVAGARGFGMDEAGIMSMTVDLPLPAVFGIMAAATMTLGNLAAIPQTNVKRLLAYSSIAHAGYLLAGFVVFSEASMQAVIFYLVIYYFMNLGAFAVVQAVRDTTGGEMISDYRGLGNRAPFLALFMAIFLLSLTGLPPLAGFIGKFYIFTTLIARGGTWFVVLAILLAINSAISLFYYMKIVRSMYLTKGADDDKPLGAHPAYGWITGALAVPVLVLGLFWTPVTREITASLAFFRSAAPPAATAATVPEATPPK